MTKAATHDMLDKLESPEMMMNQYLRELDDKIASAERGFIQQQAQERQMLHKHDELTSQASHYEQCAAQAASEEREIEARAALEAMMHYQEQASETARLIQLAREAVIDLEAHIEALKEEKSKLLVKRSELVTRAKRTQNHKATTLHDNSSIKGFERIERKVMEWEAQQELNSFKTTQYNHSNIDTSNTKQKQRDALIEEQLQQLMNKNKS